MLAGATFTGEAEFPGPGKEDGLIRRLVRRSAVAGLAAATLGILAASPAQAYGGGQASWQLTFSGTGSGFGFWGWCALSGPLTFSGGMATSGSVGDCDFAEYVHQPGSFSGTCEQSVDLTGWSEQLGAFGLDFFFTGTSVTHPASQTSFCSSLPGAFPPVFTTAIDSLLPVSPGHLDLNGLGVAGTNELQIQETPRIY
jgi:hypothetical protein